MIKNQYDIIGVMSGTSLDGIDLVYVTFHFNESWSYKIHHSETIPYSESWYKTLKNLIHFSKNELYHIDEDYTSYLGKVINNFVSKNNIKNIDAICSHGHTALHKPEESLTYQIGNLPLISKLVKQHVVCDFRTEDVALGGQGAPLVPIGDQLLFSEYDFCVNLGGFANLSTEKNNDRVAYDICPVNIVLNYYVKKLGFDFDNKGEIASKGTINHQLLDELNALDFYNLEHPKSLGLEWVNTEVFPLIEKFELDVKDVLRTCVEHMAIQISNELNKKSEAIALITGGGVYNSFLMYRIQSLCNNKIETPSKLVIEFKEALIFGFLGVLKLRGEINCLSSVTGATKNHSSGKIYTSYK